jgi:hypothetical protein
MGAGVLCAVRVQTQGMVGNHKALGLRHRLLSRLDFRVKKLFHPPTIKAHHMVMVLAFVELVHRLAAFEMVAAQNARLLKLGQNTVNRRQANVGVVLEQMTKHIFGRHVAHLSALKNFQNFQAWQSGFEAIAFEFFDVAHGFKGSVRDCRGCAKLPLQ